MRCVCTFRYTICHPHIHTIIRNYNPECSPMARETWVQSQVESYQRLKKWYLMPPCLTLSIIRYGSRVRWSNPGKEVAPSPTPWCSSYRKGSLLVALDYGRQLYFFFFITHTNTRSHPHTHTLIITHKDSNKIPKVFCIFSIFNSFHFLNCLMIVVLQKTP